MFYKLLGLALFILTPFFTLIIARLLRLRRRGILFTDLTLPLYAFECIWLSGFFFVHLLLPVYLVIMALLAIMLTIWLLYKQKEAYTYRRFFKLFWRMAFLITLIFYAVVLVTMFIQA